MYKYDFLEERQQASADQTSADQEGTDEGQVEQAGGKRRRVRIPWDALLAEDREQVGVRTLRGMIFPWKE